LESKKISKLIIISEYLKELIPNFFFNLVINLTYFRISGNNNENWSCISTIEKISKPILIMHSVSDIVVPVNHSRELFKKMNKKSEYWEVTSAEHSQIYDFYQVEFEQKVFDFIFKTLN